jgi:hypothetical protein
MRGGHSSLPVLVCVLSWLGARATASAQDFTPCPFDLQLVDRVRELTGLPETIRPHVSCAAGRFPEVGWALAARIHEPDEAWEQVFLLPTVRGAEPMARSARRELPPGPPPSRPLRQLQTADLNGDGTDEVLVYTHSSDGVRYSDELGVFAVRAGALDEIGRFGVGSARSAEAATPEASYHCDLVLGLVEIADGGRLLLADARENRPADDAESPCHVGLRAWRLGEAALEPVAVPEGSATALTWINDRLQDARQGVPPAVRVVITPAPDRRYTLGTHVSRVVRLELEGVTVLWPPVTALSRPADELGSEPSWAIGSFQAARAGYEAVFLSVAGTRSLRASDRRAPGVVLPAELNCQAVPPIADWRPWLVITGSLPLDNEDSVERAAALVQRLVSHGFVGAEAFDGRRAPRLSCCYLSVVAGRSALQEEAVGLRDAVRAAGFDAYVREGWSIPIDDAERWAPPSACAVVSTPESPAQQGHSVAPDPAFAASPTCGESLRARFGDSRRRGADAAPGPPDDCQAQVRALLPEGQRPGPLSLPAVPRVLDVGLLTALPADTQTLVSETLGVDACRSGATPMCLATVVFRSDPPPAFDDESVVAGRQESWVLLVPGDGAAPAEEGSWLLQERMVVTEPDQWGDQHLERARRSWSEAFEGPFVSIGALDSLHVTTLETTVWHSTQYPEDYRADAEALVFDAQGRLRARDPLSESTEEGGWVNQCTISVRPLSDAGLPTLALFIDESCESSDTCFSYQGRVVMIRAYPEGSASIAFEHRLEYTRSTCDSPESRDWEIETEQWTMTLETAAGERPATIVLTREPARGSDSDARVLRYQADGQGVFQLVP